jgi:uncharacterized protein (TIGR03437 family)
MFEEAGSFPLPLKLGGTSVTVTMGGTQVPAIPVVNASGQQLNVILPSNRPVGSGTVTVTYNNQTSAPAAVGPFSVSDVTGIPTGIFTGIANAQTLSRSGDLQNGQVTIFAESFNQVKPNYTQFEMLQCTAPVPAQQFTIPGWVLSALEPANGDLREWNLSRRVDPDWAIQ